MSCHVMSCHVMSCHVAGKTSSAHIIAKECGYDVVEMNASDTRNKSDAKVSAGMGGKSSNVIKVSDDQGREDTLKLSPLLKTPPFSYSISDLIFLILFSGDDHE